MGMILTMAMVRHGGSDVHGREQGKDISLNGGNQQLNDIDKDHHQGTRHTDGIRFKDKDQTYKAQDYDVPCGDRHKQTDHQGKGLGNMSDNLYRNYIYNKWQWYSVRG